MTGAATHLETVRSMVVELDRPVDLRAFLGPLARGSGDPTMRVAAGLAIRASVTPDGPGAIEIRVDGAVARARAWGPGAGHLLEGLPALLGLDDDPSGFEPDLHPLVAQLARRHGRVRLGRTVAVWDALLPAILEQRITGTEAWRNYRRLVRTHGSPAPGPLGLVLAPTPADVAALPPWRLTALGIEPRRGLLLRRMARDASRYEKLAAGARAPGAGGAGAAALTAALRAQPGIGPWTAAEVTLRALGDPDAVSIGDAHLSNVVAFALAGRPRGTDEEMLALLAPWAGHRARVVRLLEGAGMAPPRYGPRVAPRDLTRDYGRAPTRR
jgi:3-methyladenine DNA glycosylase/8-oxoguanine DNA glycosylase